MDGELHGRHLEPFVSWRRWEKSVSCGAIERDDRTTHAVAQSREATIITGIASKIIIDIGNVFGLFSVL